MRCFFGGLAYGANVIRTLRSCRETNSAAGARVLHYSSEQCHDRLSPNIPHRGVHGGEFFLTHRNTLTQHPGRTVDRIRRPPRAYGFRTAAQDGARVRRRKGWHRAPLGK